MRRELPVGDPDFGKLVECDCFQAAIEAYRYRLHLAKARLKGWLGRASFDNFTVLPKTEHIYEAIRALSQAGVGWLTLWGGYGNGKTHLLAAAVNENSARGRTAAYFVLSDLLDKLRLSYEEADYEGLMEFVAGVDLLALDEVDKVKATPWAVEKIYQIVEERYLSMQEKATLFAQNEDPTQKLAKKTALDYLYSRMNDDRCQLFEIDAGDMRKVASRLAKEG